MTGSLVTGSGFGRTVAVLCPAQDEPAVRAALPYWWSDTVDEPQRVWNVPAAAAAHAVIGELELWIAEHAVDVVFVHAGAVAFDGAAIVLPGRSMSGKTTLVAALLRAGAEYLSDEYAVLTPDGLVQPYPRPLSVRGSGGSRRVRADDLGARTAMSALPVRAVATLTFRAGAPWSVRPISPAAAVLALLDNAVAARSDSARVLDAVTAAVAGARCVAGERGDVTEPDAVVRLRSLLALRTG